MMLLLILYVLTRAALQFLKANNIPWFVVEMSLYSNATECTPTLVLQILLQMIMKIPKADQPPLLLKPQANTNNKACILQYFKVFIHNSYYNVLIFYI